MNLSIIIPVCNEAKTIADCLGSILSQLTRKQEVLLADYGSDDGTMEVVALTGGFVEFHRMNPLPQQAVFRRKTVGGGIEYALVWAETKLTQPQQSQDFIEQV